MEVNLGMLRNRKGFTLIELLIVIAIILILIAIALPNFLEAQIRARVTKANGEMRSLATALFDYNTALISSSKEGIFPPAGGVAQRGWGPWVNNVDVDGAGPNVANNNFHACSIIWVSADGGGSFFDSLGDNSIAMGSAAPTAITYHFDLRVMTSPIEAITSVPLDPFKGSGTFASQYDYFGINLRDTFVIRSLGPDGEADAGCGDNAFNCDCDRAAGACLAIGNEDKGDGPGLSQSRPTPGVDLCGGSPNCKNLTDALKWGTAVYAPTNGTKSSGDLWRFQQ
jgi:prepilin-type N-terminal cleavage/methylation domain-containing protein